MRYSSGSHSTVPLPCLFRLLPVVALMGAAVASPTEPDGTKSAHPGITLHPQVKWVETLPIGPFVRLADQRILTVDGTDVLTSADEGRTWERAPLFAEPDRYFIRIERALVQTRKGTLILAFANDRERTAFGWDRATGEPGPDARLPTYVTRSLDQGRTWEQPVKLHDDWTGAIRDIKETAAGSIVFTTMKILRHPGRHASLTYRSDDDGASWLPSNLIDLGGHGHHDGALEPTLVQLNDGRQWMLIRTTLDFFHQAWSEDDGRTWRELRPTSIDASTAPAMLQRLASGRLVLVWNRLHLEGRTDHPRRDDRQWAARAASNQRAELSIAFSEDDGRTWTRPAVIVRAEKADTSYPYVFEHQPGELWVTCMRKVLRVSLRESDFITAESFGPPRISAARPVRVACVGDSLTRGYGALASSYPTLLAGHLPGGWEVRNFGVNGATALAGTGRSFRQQPDFAAIARFAPDVVVLGLGTNDAAAADPVRRHFAADYASLVDHFSGLVSRPHLLVLTPPPLIPGRDERRRENLAGELVPIIRLVAMARGAGLVELHAAADLQDPTLYPDRVHPDARGYALMARHVAAAIRGIMAEDAR